MHYEYIASNRILPKSADRDFLERSAKLLDSAFVIPGTRARIGLDALLGLIPGVGDFIGLLLSLMIIYRAAALGIPVRGLLIMLGNVGIDALLGTVPIVGDIFDISWKANLKNVRLLQSYTLTERRPRNGRQLSTLFKAILAVVLVLVVAVSMALIMALVNFIFNNI